jgi:hypothetical protein
MYRIGYVESEDNAMRWYIALVYEAFGFIRIRSQ